MTLCLAIALVLPNPSITNQGGPIAAGNPCTRTASIVYRADFLGLREELLIHIAGCVNFNDEEEQDECIEEAWEEYFEALEESEEQYEARLELCDLLGGGAYDPEIDPDDFVAGIDNPYFTFPVGTTYVYQKLKADGLEELRTFNTGETIEILGVECTVVRDTETLEGVLVEDTFDYYAQDKSGNVWYFGELSMSFEDGLLESLDGSWRADLDLAKPGIVMEAAPQVRDTYRMEFLITEAEDAATVLSLHEDVHVKYGHFPDCLETEDFTPIEPGNVEHKFYASGIGLVMEFDPGNGEILELVDIETR